MLKRGNFSSQIIFELATKYSNERTEHLTGRSKDKALKNLSSIFNEFFSDVKFEEIDKNYLISTFSKRNFVVAKSEMKILVEFVYLLIQYGLNFDNSNIYEILFKNRFSLNAKADEVLEILTNDSKYQQYAAAGLLECELGCSICFLNIDSKLFTNQETFIQVYSYLETIKLDSKASIDSKKNYYMNCRKCLIDFFKDIRIEEITKSNIISFLNDNNQLAGYSKYIMRFFVYLADINYYIDGRFDFLINLRKRILTSGFSIEQIIHILTDSNPYKFRLFNRVRHARKNDNILVYIDNENEEIIDCINQFLSCHGHTLQVIYTFCENFDKTLGKNETKCINDFNYDTFESQILYAKDVLNSFECVAFIVAFYSFIFHTYNQKLFSDSLITPNILLRQHLAGELFRGYKIIPHNPLEKIPLEDKFLMYSYGVKKTNLDISLDGLKAIDLEDINEKRYREWCKHYIWYATPSLYVKVQTVLQAKKFFNYISEIKNGTTYSIYGRKTEDKTITALDALALKIYIINTIENDNSKYAYIKSTKIILQYVIDNELGDVQNGVIYNLTMYSNNRNEASPITNDDLSKIFSVISEKGKYNEKDFILGAILYTALITEFRISSILKLEVNCMREVSKPGEYVIISKTKNSEGEDIIQPITTYTKNHIEEVIQKTKELRNSCASMEIKRYLFIQPGQKISSVSLINKQIVNDFFKQCCREAETKEYTFENLRDTHMTKAEEYIIRNHLSDVQQTVLSGHKSKQTDKRYYIRHDIKDMLEASYGIIIGNLDTEGAVLDKVSKDLGRHENIVSNECGYCSSKNCSNYSYLDCLLCKSFVATLDRMPFLKSK